MAITTYDQLIIAYAQRLNYTKTNSITTVGGQPFLLLDRFGFPVNGSLNPGNTTNGIVPVSGNTGYPTIEAAVGSNELRVRSIDGTCSIAASITIFDVLFAAGQTTIPTAGTTTIALTSRPSFTSRIPFMADGVTRDFSAVELYVLASTALGAQAHTISVDYLDQGGAAGNTGNVSTNGLTVNRLVRLPLASGDTGVSDVTGYNVNGVASATGSVSILAMRRVARIRLNLSDLYGPDRTGFPQIFSTSALVAVINTDSASSGVFDLELEIAQG